MLSPLKTLKLSYIYPPGLLKTGPLKCEWFFVVVVVLFFFCQLITTKLKLHFPSILSPFFLLFIILLLFEALKPVIRCRFTKNAQVPFQKFGKIYAYAINLFSAPTRPHPPASPSLTKFLSSGYSASTKWPERGAFRVEAELGVII